MKLIDLDEVIDAIESTEWYHLVNGKLSEGAEGDESALYKAEDVYKAIKGVPVVDACPTLREKALFLLVEWAEECGFGYDNFQEEYETYKDEIEGMGYIDGMIYIAERVVENEAD